MKETIKKIFGLKYNELVLTIFLSIFPLIFLLLSFFKIFKLGEWLSFRDI